MGGDELARQIAERYTEHFRGMLTDRGLPPTLAATVQLTWNGTTFEAFTASKKALELEVGDGKRPPMAPIRKTMTRLRPLLMDALQQELEQGIDELVLTGVEF